MKIQLIVALMFANCFGLLNASTAGKRLSDSALTPEIIMAGMKRDIISDKGLAILITEAQANFTQQWNKAKSQENWMNPDYRNATMYLRVLIQLQEYRKQKNK